MIDSSFSLLCRVIAPAAMELLPPSTLFLPPPVDSIDSITSFVFIAAVVFCFVLISAHRPDGTILFASLTLGGGGRGWKGVEGGWKGSIDDVTIATRFGDVTNG